MAGSTGSVPTRGHDPLLKYLVDTDERERKEREVKVEQKKVAGRLASEVKWLELDRELHMRSRQAACQQLKH